MLQKQTFRSKYCHDHSRSFAMLSPELELHSTTNMPQSTKLQQSDNPQYDGYFQDIDPTIVALIAQAGRSMQEVYIEYINQGFEDAKVGIYDGGETLGKYILSSYMAPKVLLEQVDPMGSSMAGALLPLMAPLLQQELAASSSKI